MSRFANLRNDLSEQTLNERITAPHQAARMKYRVDCNTVKDARSFERAIGEYYAYHYGQCVCQGGKLPEFKAIQAAKRLVEEVYRAKHLGYVHALTDAREGLNGGMRQIYDCIADALMNEDREDYIADTIDRYAACDSFAEQRALIQDMFSELGNLLPESVLNRPPEDFVSCYRDLLRGMIAIFVEKF